MPAVESVSIKLLNDIDRKKESPPLSDPVIDTSPEILEKIFGQGYTKNLSCAVKFRRFQMDPLSTGKTVSFLESLPNTLVDGDRTIEIPIVVFETKEKFILTRMIREDQKHLFVSVQNKGIVMMKSDGSKFLSEYFEFDFLKDCDFR